VIGDNEPRSVIELLLAAAHGAENFRDGLAGKIVAAKNRAAAAVMFDKRLKEVSDAEAAQAGQREFIVEGDRPKTDKAKRAAHTALLMVLADHGVISWDVATEFLEICDFLNAGAATGFARPTPVEGATEASVWRDKIAVGLADLVSFQRELQDISREAALMFVTGIKRPGAVREPPATVAIPMRRGRTNRADGGEDHAPWKAAKRLLERGERILGEDGVRYARDQGLAERQGGPVDIAYGQARERRLKLLANLPAEKWLFAAAGIPQAAP
jgi:hypothetical protein